MPKMISLRRFHLASVSGLSYMFEPGVETEVHPLAVQEAMARGAVPVDATTIPFADNDARVRIDYQSDLRRSLIFLAIKSVVEANNVRDFDGANMPKRTVISDRLGIEVGAKELVDVYQAFTASRNEGRDFALHPSCEAVLRVVDATTLGELLDYAEEMGKKKADYKGLQIRDVRKALLTELSGVNLG